MRYGIPTYLAIAGLALTAQAATAAPPDPNVSLRTYKVTAEGSGTFQRTQDLRQDGVGFTGATKASFSWKVTIPEVVFDRDGKAIIVQPPPGAGSPEFGTLKGSASDELTVFGSEGPRAGHCTAPEQEQAVQGIELRKEPTPYNPADPGAHLIFRPFDSLRFDANCTDATHGNSKSVTLWTGRPENAFDQQFFLPKEATRQGKIIQHVEASPQQRAACIPADHMTSCTLDWSGKLTFEYVGPYGGTGPISGDDLFLPLAGDGKVAANGKTASLQVFCLAGCSGTVKAYAAKKGETAVAPAAAKPLATKRFKAAAGRPATVKLRFSGAALRKVRKTKTVRLVIDSGGKKQTVIARAR